MNIDDDADDMPDGDAALATIMWRFALGDLGDLDGVFAEEHVVRRPTNQPFVVAPPVGWLL